MKGDETMKLDPMLDGPVLSEVFDRYGWSPSRVRYIQGVLQVRTEEGEFSLKKTEAPVAKLRLLNQVSEALIEEGYEHLLSFVRTKGGEPFAEMERGNWYAYPWYGEPLGKGEPLSSLELMRQLARFHRLSQPIVKNASIEKGKSLPVQSERWKEWQNHLAEWREMANEREFTSPFDRTFQEHYDFLDKSFQFSLQGMDRIASISGGALPQQTLTHQRIHPQNLLVGAEGWRWIDWDHCAVDQPVTDIAAFLRRFLEVEEGEVVDPAALLEAYDKEWTLSRKEKKILALTLACPERPLRILHAYYQKPRRSEESVSVRRLEEEVDRLQVFQDWIRSEWKPSATGQKSGSSRGHRTGSKTGARSNAPQKNRRRGNKAKKQKI
ncbi:phosphotransferase [Marininema halotolerans]|uniref:Spore coat protein, CotS family n=1 Tax=Marininema halotolerans TaxID=1155944 RepID=A0A1I6U2X9_9BACL|nr:phosphotransferase [Marininema halotolerans]SFS95728.1 spore coat protein, CotS family [Marininema halotolerans]